MDFSHCIGLNEQFSWKTQQKLSNYCSCFTYRGSCVHTPLCHIINVAPLPYSQLYLPFPYLQLYLSPPYLQFHYTKCTHVVLLLNIDLTCFKMANMKVGASHFLRNGSQLITIVFLFSLEPLRSTGVTGVDKKSKKKKNCKRLVAPNENSLDVRTLGHHSHPTKSLNLHALSPHMVNTGFILRRKQ